MISDWTAAVLTVDRGAVTVQFVNAKLAKTYTSTTAGVHSPEDLKAFSTQQIEKYEQLLNPVIAPGPIDLTPDVPTPPDPEQVKKEAYLAALAKADELSKLVTLGIVAKDAKEYTDAVQVLTDAKAAL